MEDHRRTASGGIPCSLRQGRPQLQAFGSLALNVNSWKAVHHVRAISASCMLLATAGVDAVVSEELGEFEFTADPFGSAVWHIMSPAVECGS